MWSVTGCIYHSLVDGHLGCFGFLWKVLGFLVPLSWSLRVELLNPRMQMYGATPNHVPAGLSQLVPPPYPRQPCTTLSSLWVWVKMCVRVEAVVLTCIFPVAVLAISQVPCCFLAFCAFSSLRCLFMLITLFPTGLSPYWFVVVSYGFWTPSLFICYPHHLSLFALSCFHFLYKIFWCTEVLNFRTALPNLES